LKLNRKRLFQPWFESDLFGSPATIPTTSYLGKKILYVKEMKNEDYAKGITSKVGEARFEIAAK
jgi:hypothetical protein